jgi:predicted transport protein
MLFKIDGNKVKLVREENFDREKDIQNLIENNLADIFPDLNLTFIKTEFSIGNFRFDSVAFDKENNVFYILEYKNVEKGSLVDQGVSYLKTLLDRKYDFVNLLEEERGIELKAKDIDWAATRVIFIAPNYNSYQLKVAELNNAPFILYKFSKYSTGLFTIDKIESKKTDSLDFSDISGEDSKKVAKEIKVYSEESHLNNKSENIKRLYETLKDQILAIDSDITIDPKKEYIAFKGTTNICDVEFYKDKLKVLINLKLGQINDPFKISRPMRKEDGTKIGHHGNGDYQVVVDNDEIIDKLMYLIKESYKING